MAWDFMVTDTAAQQESDRELVKRCLRGDDQAMQALYVRHSPRTFALALRLLGSRADAEDVLQDTFLRAWRGLSRFEGDAAFGTWLYRITVNLCRDRARSRRWSEEADEQAAPPATGDALARKSLLAAMARLPAGYREVVVLHDVLELGHAEIAEVLGVAPGTSKSQLHKARVQLRNLLATARGSARAAGGDP